MIRVADQSQCSNNCSGIRVRGCNLFITLHFSVIFSESLRELQELVIVEDSVLPDHEQINFHVSWTFDHDSCTTFSYYVKFVIQLGTHVRVSNVTFKGNSWSSLASENYSCIYHCYYHTVTLIMIMIIIKKGWAKANSWFMTFYYHHLIHTTSVVSDGSNSLWVIKLLSVYTPLSNAIIMNESQNFPLMVKLLLIVPYQEPMKKVRGRSVKPPRF